MHLAVMVQHGLCDPRAPSGHTARHGCTWAHPLLPRERFQASLKAQESAKGERRPPEDSPPGGRERALEGETGGPPGKLDLP